MVISRESISWVIGGPQGSGVDSASHIFLKSIAMSGLNVFGKREYHSNIKGEHSYFSVRFSNQIVRSHVDDIDILVTFDAETIVRHSPFLIKGGIMIYDPDVVGKKIEDIHTLDKSSEKRILHILKSKNKEFSLAGIIDELKERKVILVELPYAKLINKFSEVIQDHSLSKLARITNVMSLAASLAVLDFDIPLMEQGILDTFANKPNIAELNVKAANFTYSYVKEKFTAIPEKFSFVKKNYAEVNNNSIIAQGNQTSPLGKMVAGCRFQTYYPITPATDDSEYLESNQILEQNDKKNGSVVVIQTEDEISAITMAIGAALTGVRACTTTSGPGFSLMAEALGWAGINEVPLLVSLYQRAGPSTGLPTRQEQGDLLFAISAGHGEFPRIVYSSGDIEESFYDTIRVFNYADIFQTPVIHMLDKYLSNSIITCDPFEYKNLKIERGKMLEGNSVDIEQQGFADHFKRFNLSEDPISLRVPLGTQNGIFWNTGDEHDEMGHITEDPETRINMMDKRLSKLELIQNKIPKEEQITIEFENKSTDTIKKLLVIISWGSTKGAILDSLEKITETDDTIQFLYLQIKLLNPFPAKLLEDLVNNKLKKLNTSNNISSNVETIITIIEMNYLSQLDILIKQNTSLDSDYNILKYNGRPMSHTEIYDSLINIINNLSEHRVVLKDGV
ncbi:MAG TPA: 2-oxoacid:acceptor oxidoreductase subunit alpha [Candidatus Nitrosocosmicus sp.]|nr:2-oxoacid:acceptor oxidoreductase subunit alpha [Candidatus Nitrosocosmicus sp.]